MNKLSNLNILVVEDDFELRSVLIEIIEFYGAHVYQAANGKEALNSIDQKLRIDLVLSDVQMPVMGGIELIKNIKNLDSVRPIVLLLSGQSGLTEESAVGIGAVGLIHKPYSIKTLVDRIENLF